MLRLNYDTMEDNERSVGHAMIFAPRSRFSSFSGFKPCSSSTNLPVCLQYCHFLIAALLGPALRVFISADVASMAPLCHVTLGRRPNVFKVSRIYTTSGGAPGKDTRIQKDLLNKISPSSWRLKVKHSGSCTSKAPCRCLQVYNL